MRIVLRAILYLVVIAGLGLVGYAVFSDLPAPTREIVLPVETG
jgi:hypothetical protein